MSLWRVLKHALRLRCAACGKGRLFRKLLEVHPACTECGLNFRPEAGYYIGSMYVNYFVTVALGLPPVLLLRPHVEPTPLIIGSAAFAALFSLWFHRYARSLWLAVDTWIMSRKLEPSPPR